MPRHPKFDPSIEECLTIKTSTLKDWGHLAPDLEVYNRSLSWRSNGIQLGSISYSIRSTEQGQKQMFLNYTYGGQPVQYVVDLVSLNTNLGNGKRWYFICPETGKRCMNLISPPGSQYFLHRSAFPQLMYDSQKKSKEFRKFNKEFSPIFELERLEKELHLKYRKKHYRGQATPLVRRIEMLHKTLHCKRGFFEELKQKPAV